MKITSIQIWMEQTPSKLLDRYNVENGGLEHEL